MFTRLRTPEGTRDYLPQEVEYYQYVEQAIRNSFKLWGYEEIRSPTIEYLDVLSTGVGSDFSDSMFKFQDKDGKIVALRAEMTAPVARIITTKLAAIPKPYRLFYLCDVFRYELTQFERLREFRQAGIELIGQNTPEADGEVIALLLACLKDIGLKDVRIDLGHAGVLKTLLKATNFNEERRGILQRLLSSRNIERMKQFLIEFKSPSQINELFLNFSANKTLESLSTISTNIPGIGNAIEYLLELRDVLCQYNIEQSVFFDFSLTRNIDYYTGVVFEASIPNIGVPLGGGGRYNNLIDRFAGKKDPATGFAMSVDKCLIGLTSQKFQFPKHSELKILVKAPDRKNAIELVNILRKSRITCFFELGDQEIKPMSYEHSKINYIIQLESTTTQSAIVYNLIDKSTKNMTIQDFLTCIGVVSGE